MRNIFVSYTLCLTLLISLLIPFSGFANEAATGDEIYNSISSPQTHPRLLVNNDDISLSISNINADKYKADAFDALKKRCQGYISEPSIAYQLSGGRAFDSCILARNRLIDLSAVYLLNGDEAYANRAWLELENVLSGLWYENCWNLGSHRLDSGMLFTGVAFAYDALYGYITEEQKDFVRNQAQLYIDNCLDCSFADPNKYQDSNWAAVEGAAMLLTALSFVGDDSELDAKLTRLITKAYTLLDTISSKIPADGSWSEGVGYHEYILEHLAWSIKSLFNSCGTDFGLSSYQGIANMPQYAMRMSSQNGAFNFGETTGHNTNTLLQKQFCPETMLIAEIFGDNNSKDLYNSFYKYIGIDEKYNARYLLYAPKDNDFAIKTPSFDSFCARSGISSVISSWTDDNAFRLAVQGGQTGIYNNNHYDKGSFIFEILGERWFIDLGRTTSGVGKSVLKSTSSHNVLTVKSDGDTTGQQQGEGAYPIKYASSKSEIYVVYNLTDVYKNRLDSYFRGFYVGDDRTSLTIRDEVSLSQERELCWNFITKADVELYENNTSAVLTLNGKKIYITADCSLSGWYFETKPLDLETEGLEDYTNGINIISLCAKGSGNISVAVRVSADSDKSEFYPSLSQSLDEWMLRDTGTPYVSEFHFKYNQNITDNKFFIETQSYSDEGSDVQFVIAYYNDNELKHTLTFPRHHINPLSRVTFTEDIPYYSDITLVKFFAFDDIGSIRPLNVSSHIG